MKTSTKTLRARMNLENLEDRTVLSLTTSTLSSGIFTAWSDNAASNVSITQSGSTVTVRDSTNGFVRTMSGVTKVQIVGGAANDRVVNYASTMPMWAWGNGGNDYLEGYNAVDYLMGGDGDDTLVGYGGNDMMWGGNGNDVLRGMDGDDQLMGDAGNDRLNGGAGADKMYGGTGDDVIIAIDGGIGDRVQGDAGRDIVWTDSFLFLSDTVVGTESIDKVQRVGSFANGADRTLNGDRIADPTAKAGHTYKRFYGNQLFNTWGPSSTDIRQGALGDCWLLAGLSAIAIDSPHAIRQNVVDFDDGTYGVRLGNKFYRVDDDLAVSSSTATNPAYAQLGGGNSMWVAVVEKAYAHYRSGANTFASIEGGWAVEVNRAFGSTTAGERNFNSYSSAAALGADIAARWNGYQAVTVGFLTVANGCPCIGSHMYTVAGINYNANGTVASIRLRNPWGVDGAGNDGNNDGYVTVTPAQIFASVGRVNYGRVPV